MIVIIIIVIIVIIIINTYIYIYIYTYVHIHISYPILCVYTYMSSPDRECSDPVGFTISRFAAPLIIIIA